MEQNLGEDSNQSSGSVDKFRVLHVKPLRTLVPVFPSQSNPSPFSTPQGGAPFVWVSPSGLFPPGVAPFYPFFVSPESQRFSEQNPQTPTAVPRRRKALGLNNPISTAFPINALASNGDVGSSRGTRNSEFTEEDGYSNSIEIHETDADDGSKGKKMRTRSQKRGRGQPRNGGPQIDVDAEAQDILKSMNPIVFNTLNQTEGSRDTVSYALMIYEVLRRRILQIEEARDESSGAAARRPDLRAGNIMLSKGVRTNSIKRIGAVPGVEVGDIFFFRMELCVVGLHAQPMGGIDYMGMKISQEEEPLAVSIVSSGGYEDNVEDANVLIYSGQGGVSLKDKQVKDQKLERGNLALEKSLHRGNDVRVIRGLMDTANPKGKLYVYDGLYKIQDSWVEKGKSGANVFKYKLFRVPGQPEAYTTWKNIQQWTENKSTSRVGVILPDLISGGEKVPVCLVNDVDNEKGPAYFTYFPTLKYPKAIDLIESSTGCACIGGCQPGNLNCSCIQKNGGYLPYTANGVLMNLKSMIYECGPSCLCPHNCRNRVSQGGLKFRFEVFRTKDRGWGLRSWDPIRAGSFICEYAGEVIDNARVEELGGENEDDYIFDSTRVYQQLEIFPSDTEAPKTPYPLYITAKDVGNMSRFMNHSCSPTVLWRPILRENKNESDLHVAFHSIRHIPPMTELTYDYGTVLPIKAGQKKKNCLCGSEKCRGYFC